MDTTVNNYPERFLTYLEVEKNCSQHTIESYQKDLAAFAEFMLRRNKQNFSGSRQVLWMCVAIS